MVDNNRNNANNQQLPPGQAQGQAQPEQGFDFTEIFRMFLVMIFIQFALQIILGTLGIGPTGMDSNQSTGANKTAVVQPPAVPESENYFEATAGIPSTDVVSKKRKHHTSLWKVGTVMDLSLYITEHETFQYPLPTKKGGSKRNNDDQTVLASWHEENFIFDFRSSNQRNSTVTVDISNRMKANETNLYAHIILKRRNNAENDEIGNIVDVDETKEQKDILQKTFSLTKYKLRKKKRAGKCI